MSLLTEPPTPAGTDWTYEPTTLEENINEATEHLAKLQDELLNDAAGDDDDDDDDDDVDDDDVDDAFDDDAFDDDAFDDDAFDDDIVDDDDDVDDDDIDDDESTVDKIIADPESQVAEVASETAITDAPTFEPTSMDNEFEIDDDDEVQMDDEVQAVLDELEEEIEKEDESIVEMEKEINELEQPTPTPTFYPTFNPTQLEVTDESVGVLPGENNSNQDVVGTSTTSKESSSMTEGEIKGAAIGGSVSFIILSFIFCCIYMKCFRSKRGKSASGYDADQRDTLNLNKQVGDNFHDEDDGGTVEFGQNPRVTLDGGGGGGFKDHAELGAPTGLRNVL